MITNPVLRGFNPDASAVSAGENFYIAVSTFEWYPGICVYHSKDLANWELVAAPVKEINLKGDDDSGGLWAPHLSRADGKFWLVITDVRTRSVFKDTLNYITTCAAIDGRLSSSLEWTKPLFVNASGFDPSLFHDSDGRKYFINMLWDYRPRHKPFAGIVMQEYNASENKLIGKRRVIFEGDLGVAEGPQIFKKDGYYYLITAGGGTGYKHAAVAARSKNVWGPYETSPFHPLLTSSGNPENPLQKSGHACFLPVGGEWFVTHICARPLTKLGNCVLGRETAIQSVEWIDGWPRLSKGRKEPSLTLENPALFQKSEQRENLSETYTFDSGELPLSLQSLRVPLGPRASLSERPGWLRLYGAESIMSRHEQTLVARRLQSFVFRVETKLDFTPENFQQMAGLALFYNTDNFFYAYKTADSRPPSIAEENTFAALRPTIAENHSSARSIEQARQGPSPAGRAPAAGPSPAGPELPAGPERPAGLSINLMACEHGKVRFEAEDISISGGVVYIAAEVNREKAQFYYSEDGGSWARLGGVLPMDRLSDDYIEKSKLVFTGSMVALCCQDLHDHRAFADFDYLSYNEREAESNG
jgi:xylan 1,4-beta-xylosidase